MQTTKLLALLGTLLVTACGGATDPTSGGPGGASSSGSTASGSSSGGASGASSSSSSGSSGGGAPIAAGASRARLAYVRLGEGRTAVNDTCSPSSKTFEIDLATRELVVVRCSGAPAQMTETLRVTLDDARFGQVDGELGKLREITRPGQCAFDGSSWSLEVTRGGVSTVYIDEDYNCYKRSDVKYVAPSLFALGGALEAAAK